MQPCGRRFGRFPRVSRFERHAVGNRAQRFRIHKAAQPGNHRLGELVLARQFGQGVARQHGASVGSGLHAGVFQGNAQQKGVERAGVFQVLLFLAGLDLVQRRLRDVDVAALDQLGHLAVEEGEQQRADVGAVHVGIGHDDDAVVAQLGDVEVVGAACRAAALPMPVPSAVISVRISLLVSSFS